MWSDLRQIFKYLRFNKKLWISPLILGIILLGVFLVAAQSTAIAPFVYALF